jgi:hypothetical protein
VILREIAARLKAGAGAPTDDPDRFPKFEKVDFGIFDQLRFLRNHQYVMGLNGSEVRQNSGAGGQSRKKRRISETCPHDAFAFIRAAAIGNSPKRLGECLGDLSTLDSKKSQTPGANQLNPPKTQSTGWQSPFSGHF